MKYSMKLAGILNEIGPTLDENAFHSFVVAKQIFLWQLPQLHHAIGSYQSIRLPLMGMNELFSNFRDGCFGTMIRGLKA